MSVQKKSLSQVCYLPTLKFRFILEFKDQLDKYSWRTVDNLGLTYDNHSIVHYQHYDKMAFTKNDKPIIVAIGNENMKFGAPNHLLGTRDAVEIIALYNSKSEWLCFGVFFVHLAHKGVLRRRRVLLEGPAL